MNFVKKLQDEIDEACSHDQPVLAVNCEILDIMAKALKEAQAVIADGIRCGTIAPEYDGDAEDRLAYYLDRLEQKSHER